MTTRMSTLFSPVYASTTRSLRSNFGFTFASIIQESPRSTKSFSQLLTLPKGDEESIHEESSYESTETPTEIMEQRFGDMYEHTLPVLDRYDLNEKRQFAPEYSQQAYLSMLQKEYPIGNYTGQKYAKMQISSK